MSIKLITAYNQPIVAPSEESTNSLVKYYEEVDRIVKNIQFEKPNSIILDENNICNFIEIPERCFNKDFIITIPLFPKNMKRKFSQLLMNIVRMHRHLNCNIIFVGPKIQDLDKSFSRYLDEYTVILNPLN